MNDQAIEFKALAHKIEIMIDNVSSLGVDTKTYKQKFAEILKSVEHSTAHSANRPAQAQEMFLIQDYSTGLSKLQKLEWELLRFDIYFKAINFARYLDSQLSKDMEENVLELLAKELIQMLRDLKKSSTLYYDEEKSTVEKIYETTYQMIKLELIKTGSSTIYDYCKKEEIDPYFLDRCIRRDIEQLNLQDEKYSKLKERKLFLESKGINSSYLDLELIKTILSYDDKDVLRIRIIESLNSIIAEINDNCSEYKNTYSDYKDLRIDVEWGKEKISELRKRIISVLLAGSIYITGAIGVFHLGKKASKTEYHPSKVETYSEYGYESEDSLVSVGDADKIYLKEFGIWKEYESDRYDYIREIKIYDISHIKLDTLEEYLKLDIESLGITYTTSEEKRTIDNLGTNYTQEYFGVEKITVDENSVVEQEEGLFLILLAMYCAYIVMLLVLELGLDRTKYLGILNQIWQYKYQIKYEKGYKIKEYKESLKQFKIITEKLMQIINQDEILRTRFNELFESNKFLLDNPEELLQQIEKLENTEEIKRILKKA